jgi:L-threonylcarbamoyladenylate synthase
LFVSTLPAASRTARLTKFSDAIEAELGESVDLILDGGPATGGPASTVVDCTGPEPAIRREGAIPPGDIERALRMWDDTRP